MRLLIPFSLILTILETPVHALRIPFHIRFTENAMRNPFGRRAPLPVVNKGNAVYVSNITIAGVQLPVLLDTGSSDLWANFPSNNPDSSLKDTGKSLTVSYVVGKATGNVNTAKVQLGNFTIDDQAFIYVKDTSSFGSDLHAQGYDGLLGLGPNDGSVVKRKLDDGVGDNLVTKIFEQDKTTDNYITLLLDRSGNSTEPFTGQFTVSEVVKGFENITSMPKLDVDTVNRLLEADQHWQAFTDKDTGIIGPDGQPIKIDSIVPKAPDGQLVAVFDSGFTFSQVPRDVSDAIYGRVRGAVYDTQSEYWTVPCGQYLNITFMFGGKAYPIHPLDVVDDNFNKIDGTGKKVCIGAYQPITGAFSILGHYDMVLGMSFLRNAYTLMDFGNWIDNDSQDRGHPYMQLSSIVDVNAARSDFINTRLSGSDTINDSRWSLLPADQMQHSPVSEEEKKKKYQEMILSRWPYIFTGCLVFVLILLGLCIWRCCCRKGKKNPKSKKGLFSKEAPSSVYLPLSEQNRQQEMSSFPSPPSYQPHGGYGHGVQGSNGHHGS